MEIEPRAANWCYFPIHIMPSTRTVFHAKSHLSGENIGLRVSEYTHFLSNRPVVTTGTSLLIAVTERSAPKSVENNSLGVRQSSRKKLHVS